jgi:hypothetical protein
MSSRLRLAPVLLNHDRTPSPRSPVMAHFAFRLFDVAVVALILTALT